MPKKPPRKTSRPVKSAKSAHPVNKAVARKILKAKPSTTPAAAAKPKRSFKAYRQARAQAKLQRPNLANVFSLTKTAAVTIWQRKGLFAGIAVIYTLISLLFQKSGSLSSTGSQNHSLSHGLALFGSLIGNNGSSSASTTGQASAQSVYELVLVLIVSLAVIWSLRQVLAGSAVRIRDGFYRGMYPLVPFVLVLLVIGLQLLPFLIGSVVYGAVISGGIAVHAVEQVFWGLVTGLLAAVSLFMISSSIFALYVVTLPDMTPLKALRSARGLVRYRRFSVLLRVLFLPILLVLVMGIIVVPVILIWAPAAQWIYLALSSLSLVAIHSYMYTLYRVLLQERTV